MFVNQVLTELFRGFTRRIAVYKPSKLLGLNRHLSRPNNYPRVRVHQAEVFAWSFKQEQLELFCENSVETTMPREEASKSVFKVFERLHLVSTSVSLLITFLHAETNESYSLDC